MKHLHPVAVALFLFALALSGGPSAFGQTTPGDRGGGGTGPLPPGSAPGVGVDQDQRGGINCPPGISDPLGKRQESPGLERAPSTSPGSGGGPPGGASTPNGRTTGPCSPGLGAGSGATGGITGGGSDKNGTAGNGSIGGSRGSAPGSGTASSGNAGGSGAGH